MKKILTLLSFLLLCSTYSGAQAQGPKGKRLSAGVGFWF